MKHTKEPWVLKTIDGLWFVMTEEEAKKYIASPCEDEQGMIDAQRAVDCVNFCAGIDLTKHKIVPV